MLVSVIMGVFNPPSSEMAMTAINSILNQSFENFELIICDDGSNNGVLSEIKSLVLKDHRVKVIENKANKGLHYSLNRAVEISKGKYIARMDIDDISHVDRLKIQVDFLENNAQFDMVGTNAELFDENGVWSNVKVPASPTLKDFYNNSPFIHASMLIRKDKLNKVNGYRVSKETRRAEDYDLWMRMYAAGLRGYNIQEYLYLIREDDHAYLRRKFRYRVDEMKVRYMGYKELGILLPIGIVYVIKPIVVGLLPTSLIRFIRKRRGK